MRRKQKQQKQNIGIQNCDLEIIDWRKSAVCVCVCGGGGGGGWLMRSKTGRLLQIIEIEGYVWSYIFTEARCGAYWGNCAWNRAMNRPLLVVLCMGQSKVSGLTVNPGTGPMIGETVLGTGVTHGGVIRKWTHWVSDYSFSQLHGQSLECRPDCESRYRDTMVEKQKLNKLARHSSFTWRCDLGETTSCQVI